MLSFTDLTCLPFLPACGFQRLPLLCGALFEIGYFPLSAVAFLIQCFLGLLQRLLGLSAIFFEQMQQPCRFCFMALALVEQPLFMLFVPLRQFIAMTDLERFQCGA